MFRLARFRFVATATTPIELPSGYKGSTFHGGFGHALKDLSSHFYDLFFNPTLSNPDKAPSILPKPFVLIPPLDDRSEIEPGEQFRFELILFGYSTAQFPICVAAIEHLGKSLGLGKNKGRFSITAIDTIKPSGQPISMLDKDGKLTAAPPAGATDFLPQTESVTGIDLRLNTRLRLTHNNQRVTQAPPFELFLTRLIGRIKNLSDLYGDSPLISGQEKQELINQSNTVQIQNHSIEWSEWSRYSGRQKEWMKFGGLLGNITYQGDMSPFLPWLRLGQWTHVGGKTSFGLGNYDMEITQ